MTAGPTPGPWALLRLSRLTFVKSRSMGNLIACVETAGMTAAESEHNGRLLASAPELRDALRALVNAIGAQPGRTPDETRAYLAAAAVLKFLSSEGTV